MNYDLDKLKVLFETNANAEYASSMGKYLKDLFPMYGISTKPRRELIKQFFKEEGYPHLNEIDEIVIHCMNLPQREWHYFAVELFNKFLKEYSAEKIEIAEKLITTNSWWDTVDTLAVNSVGTLFKMHPQLIRNYTDKWLNSGNMWLERSAILFQLMYKKDTNFRLLSSFIEQKKEDKEFFICKAIGWALREYSKTDAETVINYVERTQLSNLSRTEALKWLKNKGKI